MATKIEVGLGPPEHAAHLLGDLYITLRRNLQRWAAVTKQTPQPRMGYVGQHLVSVVTGFPGGRSGARGDDLKLPGNAVGEIKCCYRVDQLGKCRVCGAAVASIEKACPSDTCGSTDIKRGKDSKWLITPKDEKELRELFKPLKYYLVLFEFVDLQKADDIDVRIFEVDPRALGFALCMIDYYFHIRAKSKSAAPYNLWPHSPKFYMMKPKMIYWSVIRSTDDVETRIFPGRDAPQLATFGELHEYYRTDTFKDEHPIDKLAQKMNVSFAGQALPKANGERRKAKLALLQERRESEQWNDETLADDLARSFYREKIRGRKSWIKEFAPTL